MTSTLDATTKASKGITPVSMSRYDADFQGFSDDLGASFKRYGLSFDYNEYGASSTVLILFFIIIVGSIFMLTRKREEAAQ